MEEIALTRHDVFIADECSDGTDAEIIPVTKCDARVIGTGKPGPITKQLRDRYHKLVRIVSSPGIPLLAPRSAWETSLLATLPRRGQNRCKIFARSHGTQCATSVAKRCGSTQSVGAR